MQIDRPISLAVRQVLSEASDLLVAGERVDDLLARQLIFEVLPAPAGGAFGIMGVTDAARAAVDANAGIVPVVRELATMVDSREGARLAGIAFTDSPAGMSLVDRLAVMDGGLGTATMPPGEMRQFLPLLGERLESLPTGHAISNARTAPPADHYGWIVFGPQSSNDARFFAGDLPRGDAAWPDRMFAGGRDSKPAEAIAAFSGETLAHEGWHLRLSRPLDIQQGDTFPNRLDEARTQLATILSNDDARMTRALGMSDAGVARARAKPGGVYGAEVAALVAQLDAAGVSTHPAQRLAFIERTPLMELRSLVGTLDAAPAAVAP